MLKPDQIAKLTSDGRQTGVYFLYTRELETPGEMLGLTVETVSRIMAEFKREQIIDSPRGGIDVLSVPRLRGLSGDQMTEAEYLSAAGA